MGTINQANRIIFKVGTSTLAHPTGLLNIRRVELLVKVLSDIKNSGREIILVSSGAIGVGMGKLGLPNRPRSLAAKQACASVGQCELMYIYSRLFAEYNHTVSQVLLTRDVVEAEHRKQNAVNTLCELLNMHTLPIVNENDTVSVEEIEFGENDALSAIVASLVKADLLVILTDIDGLFDSDPNENPGAKLIPRVDEIDDKIKAIAKGRGSTLGTGGMITKVQAAELAKSDGIPTAILNGTNPKIIYDLLEGNDVGTVFTV